MKMVKYIFGAAALGALLFCAGCNKKEKTIAGVAIGAGTGALIGAAAGDAGAAVAGGAIGGVAGGLIGHSLGDDK